MTLQEFWSHLNAGGITDQGWEYNVIGDGRLHINSPDAQNDRFYISSGTVENYFNILQDGMDPREFAPRYSAWFRRVYEHIVNT